MLFFRMMRRGIPGLSAKAILKMRTLNSAISDSTVKFMTSLPTGLILGKCAKKLKALQFVNSSIRREAFYEESQAQLDEFRETLTEFANTLRRRKLDRKIDIKLKCTDEYTMDDVVKIATKVEELHQDAATMKTSMGAIRGFFRMAGENMPILKQLLQFAPSDTYGTVIFASLSMILTVRDPRR